MKIGSIIRNLAAWLQIYDVSKLPADRIRGVQEEMQYFASVTDPVFTDGEEEGAATR
jgi:hypothetical protein